MRARLVFLLRYGDPRAAMVFAAGAGALFGGSLLLSSAAGALGAGPPTLPGALGAVPAGVLGVLFGGASAVLLVGVLGEHVGATRRSALGLWALWVYAWATVPVWTALGGEWLPALWARYTLPPVMAWWVMARASSVAAGPRDPLRWGGVLRALALPAVLAVPVVALELPGGGETAVVSVVVAVLTLAGKALADRWSHRTEMQKATLLAGTDKDAFLWGVARDEIGRLSGELTALRAQFGAFLAAREAQDGYCRRECEKYGERPKA